MPSVIWVLPVALVLGCAPRGPACPPASERPTSAAGSTITLADGTAGLEVHASDRGGEVVPGLELTLRCPGPGMAPATVATDSEGVARFAGLAPAACELRTEYDQTVVLTTTADRTFILTLEDQPAPLSRGDVLPADALPPGVVMRVDAGACLGSCRSYVADVHDDGTVTVVRDGQTRRRRVKEDAYAFALQRARCLARGPSYPQEMVSDGQRIEVWVRDGDGVATYVEESADARAPAGQYERTRELEDVLKLR